MREVEKFTSADVEKSRANRGEIDGQAAAPFASRSRRRMTDSTMLSGVEAPEVRPMATGPPGSHPVVVISCFPPIGLWVIAEPDARPAASAMWYVGRLSAQIRA